MDVLALVVGELTAHLSVDNDAYKRGIRDAKSDLDGLARDAERQSTSVENRTTRLVNHVGKSMRDTGKVAEREGERSGGLLARGMQHGVMRNSPLIVAGVAAALAAGAPAALAGATAMFAGVGIVAQSQSVAVRSAWSEAWRDIKSEAFEQSRALEPVLVGLADQVSDAFRDMGPVLRSTFEDAAPQMQVFANGVLGLAQNALPGLARAVEAGMPVTRGLADFLERVGTGLTGFLDAMTAHAPAAGSAFASLGGVLGELLPLLGELLGQGAELASATLPLLVTALKAVNGIVGALGPLLPAVVAGFGAMKIAQAASGWVGGLGDKLKEMPARLAGVNAGVAAFSIALGIAVTGYQRATDQGRRWAEMLREGGAAAEQAQRQMSSFGNAFAEVNSGWDGFANALLGTSGQISATAIAMGEAEDASRDLWNAMSPLEQAQSKVAEWTETLTYRLSEYGAGSDEVEAAQRRLAHWTGELASEQGDLEMALDGVTSAMIEQADQALAAIDSGFAYRRSLDQLEDAQAALNEALAANGAGSEEAQRAQLALEEQTFRTAAAFAQQQADLSGLEEGTAQYDRFLQERLLTRLVELREAAGPGMRAAIDQQIAALRAAGVTMDGVGTQAANATGRLQTLAAQRPNPVASLNNVPFIGAALATEQRMARIAALRADPRVTLHAETSTAEAQLNYAARSRTATVYLRQMGAALRDGGPIFAATGTKVSGPGGPRDDLVRAMVPNGPQYRLSPGEWIINALRSAQQGDGRMAALNAGRADIVLHGERKVSGFRPIGRAGGGPVGDGMDYGQMAQAFAQAMPGMALVSIGEYHEAPESRARDVAQELAYELRVGGR